VLVRFTGTPAEIADSIRARLKQMNNEQVVFGVQTMEEIIAQSLAARRLSMILLGAFAVLARLLSSVGIYGVISYLVGQRTHEIGIRMSLGADRSRVLRSVMLETLLLASCGVALGIPLALASTRLIASRLFGITGRAEARRETSGARPGAGAHLFRDRSGLSIDPPGRQGRQVRRPRLRSLRRRPRREGRVPGLTFTSGVEPAATASFDTKPTKDTKTTKESGAAERRFDPSPHLELHGGPSVSALAPLASFVSFVPLFFFLTQECHPGQGPLAGRRAGIYFALPRRSRRSPLRGSPR